MKTTFLKQLLTALFIIIALAGCKDNSNMMNINITIDTSILKPISPYIYGMNGVPPQNELTATAYRLGGNRMTGYNWENNLSNAGEDWHHFNDDYMVPRDMDGTIPGITVTDFTENAQRNGGYVIITLPMAGYVANDRRRTVSLEETAPSSRFAQIINRKNAPLSLIPDLYDGVVYSDEFINFLINRFGRSNSGGINGYSLDNEPALWSSTHPRIHPEKTTVAEILEKTISLASVVKDLDPDAEVFGPVLYGLAAYSNFQDAPDWRSNYSQNYRWFIDAYLDGMRLAEEENGRRLLDVLDLHYYTEARCALDHRVSDDRHNNENCIHTRFQSTRTLWDWTYRENSWVQRSLAMFLPVLPMINTSIENYYPGTKLAITEYNFGHENHISGGIAQADALGIFAAHGVYLAAVWPLSNNLAYTYAGINLYTNYDGNGSRFGNNLAKSTVNNNEYASVYASIGDDGALHIIILNKNQHDTGRFSVDIQSGTKYRNYRCYGFNANSSSVVFINSGKVGADIFVCVVPPLSAYHFVLR